MVIAPPPKAVPTGPHEHHAIIETKARKRGRETIYHHAAYKYAEERGSKALSCVNSSVHRSKEKRDDIQIDDPRIFDRTQISLGPLYSTTTGPGTTDRQDDTGHECTPSTTKPRRMRRKHARHHYNALPPECNHNAGTPRSPATVRSRRRPSALRPGQHPHHELPKGARSSRVHSRAAPAGSHGRAPRRRRRFQCPRPRTRRNFSSSIDNSTTRNGLRPTISLPETDIGISCHDSPPLLFAQDTPPYRTASHLKQDPRGAAVILAPVPYPHKKNVPFQLEQRSAHSRCGSNIDTGSSRRRTGQRRPNNRTVRKTPLDDPELLRA